MCVSMNLRFKLLPPLALLLSMLAFFLFIVLYTAIGDQQTMEEPHGCKHQRQGGHQQRRVKLRQGSSIDDNSTDGGFFVSPGAKKFVESWCWGQVSVPRLQNRFARVNMY
jgi:hypothetical protein